MRTLKLLKMGMVGLVGLFANLLVPSVSQAIVSPGYDLLYTVYANYVFFAPIGNQEFVGLPLGSHTNNCFGENQTHNVNSIDTIICRETDATPGQDSVLGGSQYFTINNPLKEAIIPIDFEALLLRSVNPIAGDLGGTPEGYVLATNVQDIGSEMKITWDDPNAAIPSGTFDSHLNFIFDFVDATTGQF